MRLVRMRQQRESQGRPRELSAFTSPCPFLLFFRRVIDSVVANGKRAFIKELPAEDFAGSQVGLEFDGMKSSDLPVLTHGHSSG